MTRSPGPQALARRFSVEPERLALLERIFNREGTIRTSETVARQLTGPRNYIPIQSILDVIGTGTRVPDPHGVAGRFMFSAPASFNQSVGRLEVLANEQAGIIEHVLFRTR